MLKIRYSSKFKKDYKLMKSRGLDFKVFEEVLYLLCSEKEIPKKFKDHSLSGEFRGFRECHILPDWLLIYKMEKELMTLDLVRTGTHSDLF